MAIILSLQGCMAVGKTTAVKYIQENAPYVNISYEINNDVIDQIKSRNLNKNELNDYVEIQKLWIAKEILRWQKAQQYSCSLMDFGAEEIEFYTLNYPKSIGANWYIEPLLKNELEELRQCLPNRILFFDADLETLRSHKENDTSRTRDFFNHHIEHLLPLKKKWFIGRDNVDILCIDSLSKDEVGNSVKKWIDSIIAAQV